MTPEQLIEQLNAAPQDVTFEQVMAVIDAHYDYTPSRFVNGKGDRQVVNQAGENEGSCKLLFFAMIHELNEAHTLACFGKYYREDVLRNLAGSDHPNIRSFMRHGWDEVEFDAEALRPKG